MKIFLITILLSISTLQQLLAREEGQIEITTEEGIEVFQSEKYYLLKNNVIITSDDFQLKANLVKAFYEKDLYDITKIESEGNTLFTSKKGMSANGEILNFSPQNETISIKGKNSSLIINQIKMFSSDSIFLDNILGTFNIIGENAKLITEDISISGNSIEGKYINVNDTNEVIYLNVEDDKHSNIITSSLNMFSDKAKYNKKENIIELFENVEIERNNETITGDYAIINTLNESYKIQSKNSKKVKLLINNANE